MSNGYRYGLFHQYQTLLWHLENKLTVLVVTPYVVLLFSKNEA